MESGETDPEFEALTPEQECTVCCSYSIYIIIYYIDNVLTLFLIPEHCVTCMVVVIRDVVCVAMTLVATLVMINDIMQCTLSVQSYFSY